MEYGSKPSIIPISKTNQHGSQECVIIFGKWLYRGSYNEKSNEWSNIFKLIRTEKIDFTTEGELLKEVLSQYGE